MSAYFALSTSKAIHLKEFPEKREKLYNCVSWATVA